MTLVKWGLFGAAVLLLAACQGQTGAVSMSRPPGVGPVYGIDLPIDASDVLNELKTSRIHFVARYYRDPASRWPSLNARELQRLSALGLTVVTIWEWRSHDPAYLSYATGYGDALSAYQQARAAGQPPGSAIYFAVDFNARGPAMRQVEQYFHGIDAGFAFASRGRFPSARMAAYRCSCAILTAT